MIRYSDLERRYGETVALFFLREIEKASKIHANDNDFDYEARLALALHAQDQSGKA